MGLAPLPDAQTFGDLQLSIFAAHADASPGISRRSHVSFGERGGQAYDSDGVVERPAACRGGAASVYRGGVVGGKLGLGLRFSGCVFRLLRSLRIPSLVHASAEAAAS